MAKNETRRIQPKLLQDDLDALDALEDIADYAPSNSAYTLPRCRRRVMG